MLDDAVYYSRREAAERSLAETTSDPRVRAVHIQLADKYLELAHRALAEMPMTASQAAESLPSSAAAAPIGAGGRFR